MATDTVSVTVINHNKYEYVRYMTCIFVTCHMQLTFCSRPDSAILAAALTVGVNSTRPPLTMKLKHSLIIYWIVNRVQNSTVENLEELDEL